MKFKINSNSFTKKLTKVISTIGSGNIISMPALKSVFFNVTSDKIEIIGSNGKTSIKTKLIQKTNELEIERTGSFMLGSRNLLELVRRIDSEFIVFEQVETNIVTLITSKSRFSLTSYDVATYPTHKFELKGTNIIWKTKILKEISREIVFAADTQNKQQNQAFKGINCISEKGVLKIIATNSHRLSTKETEAVNEDFNIVMQPQVFKLTPKFLNPTTTDLPIWISPEKTQIVLDEDILQFQNIQEKYPDIAAIIPTEFFVSVITNRKEITNALERINILSSENKKVKMKLTEESLLFISQQNVANSVIEKIENYNKIGKNIEISFSSDYLLDALNATATDEIKIEFTSEEKPFIVWNNKSKKTIHLISPFRNT